MSNISNISDISDFPSLFANSFNNVTISHAQETEGLTQGVYLILNKIVEVLTTSGQFGFWKFLIVLFAIVGFFAIISVIGNKIFSGVGIIFKFFILIPAIFIIGFINKKKRKKRLIEWGEIKKDFKTNSKKIKKRYWIIFIIFKVLLPLILLVIILLGII